MPKPPGFADDGSARKTAQVVCRDVAPNEPPNEMRWLKEKPVPTVPKIPVVTKR